MQLITAATNSSPTQRPGLHNKQTTVQQYGIAAQRRKETALSAHKTHTNLGVGTTTDRDTQGSLHTCETVPARPTIDSLVTETT